MTRHRRENFGEPLRRICTAVHGVLDGRPDVFDVLPVHPNPNVRAAVGAALSRAAGLALSSHWATRNSSISSTGPR
ncbi:MAG: hypothetical protein ACRC1K_19770 [Planctomycetia bacterium]